MKIPKKFRLPKPLRILFPVYTVHLSSLNYRDIQWTIDIENGYHFTIERDADNNYLLWMTYRGVEDNPEEIGKTLESVVSYLDEWRAREYGDRGYSLVYSHSRETYVAAFSGESVQ
jgi:hypothetical protein